MYRIIPFDEINKNKWNGTVHYALNGNAYGYHWYLKAVIGEWDAIVEADYETVLPVFKSPLRHYQYHLLKELGPYSVNPLTEDRVDAVLDLLKKHNKTSQYPIHSEVSYRYLKDLRTTKRMKAILPGGSHYETLSSTFSDELTENLGLLDFDKVRIVSSLKPETIVALSDENDMYKNACMRLMYNAMHRGIGFSSAIEDKKSGDIMAASFFVNTNTSIYEILSVNKGGKKYRQLLYDLMLRNNSGSPAKFESFDSVNDLHELGFDSEPVYDLQLKNSTLITLKKSFGRAF